jgi:uncharacterized alpha-E superfamily protein
LILDRLFPRAIMQCVDNASKSLHAISGSPETTFWNSAEKSMGKLHAELAYAQVDEIVSSGLHEFLDSIQTKLNHVDDAINETFFATEPIAAAGGFLGAASTPQVD